MSDAPFLAVYVAIHAGLIVTGIALAAKRHHDSNKLMKAHRAVSPPRATVASDPVASSNLTIEGAGML